jgi:hypothetical protein
MPPRRYHGLEEEEAGTRAGAILSGVGWRVGRRVGQRLAAAQTRRTNEMGKKGKKRFCIGFRLWNTFFREKSPTSHTPAQNAYRDDYDLNEAPLRAIRYRIPYDHDRHPVADSLTERESGRESRRQSQSTVDRTHTPVTSAGHGTGRTRVRVRRIARARTETERGDGRRAHGSGAHSDSGASRRTRVFG